MLLLVRIIDAPYVLAARRSTQAGPGANPRILLLRPDHLGDLVMTTPVLDALREHAPDARITMMVGPWSREVVARHPAIDHLTTCPFPAFTPPTHSPLAPSPLLFNP